MLATFDLGRQFTSHWWVFLVRGILALAFGALFIAFPSAGVVALVILFAIYAFMDAILSFDVASRDAHDRGWLIFGGIVGLACGVAAIRYPAPTAYVLALLMGIWAIFTGVMELMLASNLRRQIANEISIMLVGVLTLALGVYLLAQLFNPSIALTTMVLIVAIYAFIAGFAYISFAFRLKKIDDSLSAA